ncbi:hypothetical protein PUR34_38740 [Streptomyces sp. JV185]|uniref:hypothetical protein n=1 Tax=Streptomyces sp. JV185 TaxID=858638 RepID=UPI002E7A6D47|nr:hypothetical protein [Streptomyces sp. JV185]MEE1773954.1 hypothetical protein [Streptomyces sp. JV185]
MTRPFSTLRDIDQRSAGERPLSTSLLVSVLAGAPSSLLSRLRVEFHESLFARADARIVLTESVLCAYGPANTQVEPSLTIDGRIASRRCDPAVRGREVPFVEGHVEPDGPEIPNRDGLRP